MQDALLKILVRFTIAWKMLLLKYVINVVQAETSILGYFPNSRSKHIKFPSEMKAFFSGKK